MLIVGLTSICGSREVYVSGVEQCINTSIISFKDGVFIVNSVTNWHKSKDYINLWVFGLEGFELFFCDIGGVYVEFGQRLV